MSEPVRGEVWADTEGVLIVYMGEDRWLAFGNPNLMTTDELVDKGVDCIPTSRVFDTEGYYQLGDESVYPSKSAFRD